MEHKQEIDHKELLLVGSGYNYTPSDDEVTFFHDFVAGGIAGSASVVIGHPFDTIKVRLQTSASEGLYSMTSGYGGFTSLFRGLAAPLSSACIVNAVIFSSYGWSSRLYDDYWSMPRSTSPTASSPVAVTMPQHDSITKSAICGAFTGFVQSIVICPVEHIKCRLQVQHGVGSLDHLHAGSMAATRSILASHGVSGLFRGWAATLSREVPSFAAYFACYDIAKERVTAWLARNSSDSRGTSHTWIASALAGGITGALNWFMIYPMDVVKSHVQTLPLNTPLEQRRMHVVAREIVQRQGMGALVRGLPVTLLRAFPVNATVFPQQLTPTYTNDTTMGPKRKATSPHTPKSKSTSASAATSSSSKDHPTSSSSDTKKNDLPPSAGYLLSCDVPTKQYIQYLNELKPVDKKFILEDLDSTHLLIKKRAREEIERKVEAWMDENVFSAVERVGESLDMS
eukprot:Nitzschia sp. Nitz4//scaffold264_size26629//20958//22908//NITZ4_008239-RA/size26629-snap-gene-0.29-mRNA-1//1//CDS//3329544812//2111//frame0